MRGGLTTRLALAGLVALGGCGSSGSDAAPLSDSLYVDAMVRLLEIRTRYTERDSVRANDDRQAVMDELGITPDQLRRYAERFGSDPEHLLRIWEAIERKSSERDSVDQDPARVRRLSPTGS